MSKQDDHFQPEQVDEQIERLAHVEDSSTLPEAGLVSDLQQLYTEEHDIIEQVRTRLNSHIAQSRQGHTKQKRLEDHAPFIGMKEAKPMKIQDPSPKNRWRALELIAAVLVVAALVGSMAVIFNLRQAQQSALGSHVKPSPTVQATSQPTPSPTATPLPTATSTPSPTPQPTATPTAAGTPEVPTSVTLRVEAKGVPPTAQGKITIPAGTTVTLSVVPDHSLLPFQTYTMGIYATDPYGFSELQYCTYPNTATCTYTIAYSSSEQTDYTKGTHTFVAFLGDIGGRINYNSPDITITWSK